MGTRWLESPNGNMCRRYGISQYGIEHNCCIDGELMKRIFADDDELVYYLHIGKLPKRDMFGEIPPIPKKNKESERQRSTKDLWMYGK